MNVTCKQDKYLKISLSNVMQVPKAAKVAFVAILIVVILVASVLIVEYSSSFGPTPSPASYQGEVLQYQNISLTPISGFIGAINAHPDVAIEGTQYVNETTYRLAVTGLVNNSLELSYDDVVNDFPAYQQVTNLLCVEGWSVTMLWEGARVSDIIQEAGVSSNATVVIFHASDGYTTALPLDYLIQENIILAYKVNNVTLPPAIGFPFCLVAQNQYGYKWIKWVNELEVSNNTNYLGFWESRGYPNNATVNSP